MIIEPSGPKAIIILLYLSGLTRTMLTYVYTYRATQETDQLWNWKVRTFFMRQVIYKQCTYHILNEKDSRYVGRSWMRLGTFSWFQGDVC